MVILVVEDEAIVAYCSAAILEDAGHTVIGPAHTAREALELARGQAPDVALVDIDLEIPSAGIGVARQLREQYGTAIVFVTGQMDMANAHCDIAVGAISKPYDPGELPSIVAAAQSARRPLAAVRPRTAIYRCVEALTSSN